ncbi:MAG: hypothetical protein AB1782_19995 [Cyanobacteriota bacterium]
MSESLKTVKPTVQKLPINDGKPKTYFSDHMGLSVGIQKRNSIIFKGVKQPKFKHPLLKDYILTAH